MNNPNNEIDFCVLKLVKRDKPAVVPQPVFFDNAPGDLCEIKTTSAHQMGVDAAKSTLEALAADEYARI